MPFTVKDAERHNSKLRTAKQKRQWRDVANDIRSACIKKGGAEKKCDAQAILRANGVLKKQMEEAAMNGDLFDIASDAVQIALAVVNESSEVDAVTADQALRKMREQLKAFQPSGEVSEVTDQAEEAAVTERIRFPSFGITSFADLRAAEAADDAADEIRLLTTQFNEMINNIMWDREISDKGAAVRALTDEFVGLIEDTTGSMGEADPGVDSSIGAIATVIETSPDSDVIETEVAELGHGSVIGIVEADSISPRSPLVIDVAVIEPGWGNTKNNNYYPAAMLAEEAHKLKGIKMYVTQHNDAEKNVRTEVSEILECPVAFTSTGGPIARVGIFDAQFAENTRNRAALGKLEHLHTSLYGRGAYKKGTVDGRKGCIIERFTHIGSVDWVTKAGAGGRALNIVESDEGTNGGDQMDEKVEKLDGSDSDAVPVKETVIEEQVQEEQLDEEQVQEIAPEPEETVLSEAAVEQVLADPGVNLPKISAVRLAERTYPDEQALREAIKGEVAYVKALTGSGKPQNLNSAPTPDERMTAEQYAAEYDQILVRHGMQPLSERS